MSEHRVYVSAGHNKRDPGACSDKSGKYICEAQEVREVADAVADELRRCGIKAYRDTWEMSWQQTVDDANAHNVEIFIEIHENAGGGDGSEIIIHNDGNRYIANAFEKQVKAMGQKWRRTIVDPAYWVLKYTYAPAAIFELCFVDSKDILDFDSPAEKRRAAQYIARAICQCIGAQYKAASSSGSKPPRKPKMCEVELPDVRKGDKHPAARRCMALLRYRGYLPDDYFCGTGAVFDAKAEKALKHFQERNGLKTDGWCGGKTWYQLIAD